MKIRTVIVELKMAKRFGGERNRQRFTVVGETLIKFLPYNWERRKQKLELALV